jgi:hypothetical protein
LLDDILDDMEEKKGIESTKAKSDKKDNSFGSHHGSAHGGAGMVLNPPRLVQAKS